MAPPPNLQCCSPAIINSSTNQIEFNYSKLKHVAVGQYISSPPFCVGGYDWVLKFYPHGSNSDTEKEGTHVSIFLKFLSEAKGVDAEFSFKVLDKTGKPTFVFGPILRTFSSHPDDGCRSLGYRDFISMDKLEAVFCKERILVISFSIRVLNSPSEIYDCSGGLCDDIKELWEGEDSFDVTFEVEGEKINAHRFMLAARSPVFKAELYGSMKEAKSRCIKIHDMKFKVFMSLLRFIYTDDYEDSAFKCHPSDILVQDLFVAADRYALEKLKVQCQQRLWMSISIDTVLTTLILAERHSSAWLKEKCLEFASKSENLTQLSVTEEYVQMMQSFPSLLVELRQKVKDSSDSMNVRKKQRTS
ncbi:BTB/POZ and MATH domain-containing protein 2 [Rhynchospora pubera]|uniref:BTB/POZ and MATH domain-containing protein 2 n=1 Tax=Rhynchospora pubera TaxID=906938 RepID=A0AAV8ESP6_9POAL|nr:BTB/POZ and MATH domain-containing protein 2 [Rhynchospora pubera]